MRKEAGYIALLMLMSLQKIESVSVCTNASPLCASPPTNNMKFSVLSQRNLTGHWVAEVQMEHIANQGSGLWKVDVDHSTAKCGELETILITATVAAPKGKPPVGYELVPGFGYYKFYVNGKTWQDAQDTCMQEGAHLVIPNSDEEFVAIKKIWDRYPSPYTDWRKSHVWMGVSDIAQEGNFKSVLGETLNETGYSKKWALNQPDGGVKEDCIVLTVNTLLHDTACAAQPSFICERGLQ